MRTTTIFLCFAAVLALAYSSPLLDQETLDNREEHAAIWVPAGETTEEHVERFKRATCDLLSFSTPWFTANDAACAGHCLVKGYKGGKCRDGICHCRN